MKRATLVGLLALAVAALLALPGSALASGHGHRGRFQGFIGEVPVYNVAVQVMGRDFFVFELNGSELRPLA